MSSASSTASETAAGVAKIVEKHGSERRNLIPILHDVQREMGYVSEESMEAIADCLGIAPSQVYGTATFYTLFYTKPQGKHIVRICDSPPCHIAGGRAIGEAISKHLGLEPGVLYRGL